MICDDVDAFFNNLKEASKLAEEHHENYRKDIIDSLGAKQKEIVKENEKIYSFPLIINTISTIESHIYNIQKLENYNDYIEKYFKNSSTWYLFIIPQKK